MLTEQYRMHQSICDWASRNMYEGRLAPSELIRNRRFDFIDPMLLVDTGGCYGREAGANDAGSKYNEFEGSLVAPHIKFLISKGVKEEEIALVTPYNGQVQLLKRLIGDEYPMVEVRL